MAIPTTNLGLFQMQVIKYIVTKSWVGVKCDLIGKKLLHKFVERETESREGKKSFYLYNTLTSHSSIC